MKIFADQCVHIDVIEALRKNGFKTEKAADVHLEKASDEEVFNYVLQTSKILLTFDKDFGNITRFDIKKSSGVVIIDIKKISKEIIIKMVISFFNQIKIGRKTLKGVLYIVEPDSIRTWPKK